MLRQLLREQLKRVERGLDPINTMRDPSANNRLPTGALIERPPRHVLAPGNDIGAG